MKAAIIGGGPRGLWAVEELASRAGRAGVSLDVHVFEPGQLGLGSAYSPQQPSYKRMNVTSRIVSTALGSFTQWRHACSATAPRHSEAEDLFSSADDYFPARALVGEFLIASWEHALGNLPRRVTVTVHHEKVTTLQPVKSVPESAERWSVNGSIFDRVLLAAGHASTWPGAFDPVVAEDRAPIALRGLALTFIDATLDLTEGRGGYFQPAESPEFPGQLTYVPSGREPRAIVPFSRSGRFMETKVDPEGMLAHLDLEESIIRGSNQVRLASTDVELTAAIAKTACEMLSVARCVYRTQAQSIGNVDTPANYDEQDLAAIHQVLAGSDAGEPVEDLRQSLLVATGSHQPTARWAAGHAFRTLYPAIVERTSFGGRVDFPGFGDLARRMERVAFGPPIINSAKILALLDAGILSTQHLTDGQAARATTQGFTDCVIAPPGLVPGTLAAELVSQGIAHVPQGHRGIKVHRDGSLPDHPTLAIVGRDTEDVVLGPDTLSRTLHDVVTRWARGVVEDAKKEHSNMNAHTTAPEPDVRSRARATVPLTARLEPWMVDLAADPTGAQRIIETYGSPTNVLHTAAMRDNVEELVTAGRDRGIDVRVFYARKANKALCFVDTMRDAGHGVDVASYRELAHVLDRGVPGPRIILSAAIKPDELLELAIRNDVTISVDNVAEMRRIEALAASLQTTAIVAPRLAPRPDTLPATRFGELGGTWSASLSSFDATRVRIAGVHVHLHGYAAADRRTALQQCFELIDAIADAGHTPEFIDLGGGVPMSYLDDAKEFENFHTQRQAMIDGEREPFTWKADPLANTYPFHQSPTRGAWLQEVLDDSIVAGMQQRNLRLHLEPGRSILDGCGMILARVAFTKTMSDGTPLVGLEMNRTQCRTTADDILLDPLLIPAGDRPEKITDGAGQPAADRAGNGADNRAESTEGFLVGAYCIEDEVIIRRKMEFPEGIAAGDIIAIPNSAGYFMHILESASHQIPLAKNVVMGGISAEPQLDLIDQ